jgi:hypothetical protein
MRISRCVWHPRNYGHAKLLGVSSWRGRGVAFTAGLCDKCAARIHPAARPNGVRGVDVPKHGRTAAIVVVLLAVMTGLVLVVRPASDVPSREMPPPGVASRPQEAPLPHEAPPRRLMSSTLPRPGRVTQPTHPESPAPAGRVSRARASRPTESSTPRTGRLLYQSP